MAIVELTCLGERRFDVSGYPHDRELDGLTSDWQAFGQDFRSAAKTLNVQNGQTPIEPLIANGDTTARR
jgi:hypothetical protein